MEGIAGAGSRVQLERGLRLPCDCRWSTVPSVPNVEEPGHGELCCAGQADGEERDGNFGGQIAPPRALSKRSPTLPDFPPTSLVSFSEENVQERELMILVA